VVGQGQQIGRFVLEQLIARTPRSEVWRAHLETDPIALGAVKIYLGDKRRKRAHRGWKMGLAINAAMVEAKSRGEKSRNLVKALDAELKHEPLCVVWHYVNGPNLRTRLRDHAPWSTDRKLEVVQDIARGLAAAHATELIHGDLKPENVLLEGGVTAKLADFAVGTPDIPKPANVVLGSLPYMAPEQRHGEAIDHRIDLWAMGLILFELFTGGRPHVGDTLDRFAPDLPAAAHDLFARCFVPAEQRLDSAAEAVDILDAARAAL
jgi:serine/threonine-protein kinase